jgi:hypothetical protein
MKIPEEYLENYFAIMSIEIHEQLKKEKAEN